MHSHDHPDVIDSALRAAPGSPLAQLRRERQGVRDLSQANYAAALRPADPRNFSPALRAALAARMTRLWNCRGLAEHYDRVIRMEGGTDVEIALAEPTWQPADADGRLAAILRHVDLVTLKPRDATEADIAALYAAGLDDRDIVTLTGLIAFVNYQILIVSGLSALSEN